MDEGQYDGKVETICYYNIAFVNSERWLAKSRVDINRVDIMSTPKISFFIFVRAIL
jgi:hypothetical protein